MAKQKGLTDRQIKTYQVLVFLALQFIFGIVFLCYMGWILNELFKETTTEASRWKFTFIELALTGTVFAIVKSLFPSKKD